MLALNIKNETSKLRTVVLGSAFHNGPTPKAEEAYDPKSLEHILAGTYPEESAMILEMEAFKAVLQKYNVTVLRPEIIENYNQIFTRDIGFVVGDIFVKSNIRISFFPLEFVRIKRTAFLLSWAVIPPDLVIISINEVLSLFNS